MSDEKETDGWKEKLMDLLARIYSLQGQGCPEKDTMSFDERVRR